MYLLEQFSFTNHNQNTWANQERLKTNYIPKFYKYHIWIVLQSWGVIEKKDFSQSVDAMADSGEVGQVSTQGM